MYRWRVSALRVTLGLIDVRPYIIRIDPTAPNPMPTTRRAFLRLAPAVIALVGGAALPARLLGLRRIAHPDPGRSTHRETRLATHPEPRPGIDAAEVLTAEQLVGASDEVIALYDGVREMPHIADGIGCTCGCALMLNYRSLLTCYESSGLARGCPICQGTARIAYRRWKEGQSLEQIRRALDARYG